MATRYSIDRLEVRGFRGIKERTALVLGGKSLVLLGGNGTGKSAFVEALERILTGRISTLEGRGLGISFQRHGPHIHAGPNGWQIELTLTGGPALPAIAPAADLPSNPADYFMPAREPVYILRRSQVLQLLEAQPSERYEMLRPFLPLANLTAMESAASEAVRALRAEAQEKASIVSNAEADLRREIGLVDRGETVNAAAVLGAVNQRLAAVGVGRVEGLDALPTAVRALDALIRSLPSGRQAASTGEAVAALRDAAVALRQIDPSPLQDAKIALAQAETEIAGHFYESVLIDGARWIEEDDLIQCPLCEQEMTAQPPDAVLGRARARLEQHSELLAARARASRERASLAAAVGGARAAMSRAYEAAQRLADEQESLKPIWQWAAMIEAAPDLLGDDSDAAITAVEAATTIKWGADLDAAADELTASLVAGEANETVQAVQTRELAMNLERKWGELERARLDCHQGRDLEDAGTAYLGSLQTARKEMLTDIFDSISSEIERLYRLLHDEPETGQTGTQGVRLELRAAVTSSVNIRGDFYDRKDEDPRALYSEAHLDTLGIAAFLALRRWYRQRNPGFDLLVLDDVVTSVDNAHESRLASLLIREFKDYQLVLTTHDRVFYEYLKELQDTEGVSSRFVNLEIVSWDLDSGPNVHEPVDQVAYLRSLLAGANRPAIAWAAGRLLEGILREMRFRLGLSVQAKRGERYEIGDIWPKFFSSSKTDFPGLYANGAKALDTLNVEWPLRNWLGAHFNDWAQRVSLDESRRFGLAVCALFDLVYCRDCRDYLDQSRFPRKQLACRAGHRVLPGTTPGTPVDRPAAAAANVGSLKGANLATVHILDEVRRRDGGAS
jgi:energy-coupling factor transporter ATP-binding protein EcfA2